VLLRSLPARGVAARRGRALLLVALVVVLGGAVWVARLAESRVEAGGYHLVDPARIRLDVSADSWFDPRWANELEALLASTPPFALGDEEAEGELRARIEALSFVAELAEPEPIWPDGMRLRIRPRTPVACIQRGGPYQPVAGDGVVLAGLWTAPPSRGSGWLPVIGPHDASTEALLAGSVLVEERHLDALSISVSMWEHLDAGSLDRLGRIVIDASALELDPVGLDGGARLWLEGGREIVFGRAPRAREPGELPESTKWRHVVRALAHLWSGDPATVWRRCDVRWDRPELDLSEPAEPRSSGLIR
jgi:hypothetical protein